VDTLPDEQEAIRFRTTLDNVAELKEDSRMRVFLHFLSHRSYLDDATRTSVGNTFRVITGLDGDILRHNLDRHGLLYVPWSVTTTAGWSTPHTAGGSTGTLTTVPTTHSSRENKDEEYALMQLSVVEGTLPTLPEREANLFHGHLADSAADNQPDDFFLNLSS